jgi:hypothetical protein
MKNILPVLVLISYLTIQPALSNPIATKNWKKLTGANYSIQYPADWDLQQKEDTTPDVPLLYPFAILSPLESTTDTFRENVNLVVEQLAGRTIEGVDGKDIDLERYIKLSSSQLSLYMNNYHSIENKQFDNGRRQYYRSIFTWDFQTFRLKVEQYYWVADGKAYVLTFTSERDKFAKFKETGEKILDTFTIERK